MEVTATDADGQPVTASGNRHGDSVNKTRGDRYDSQVRIRDACPCCQATLVIDTNLRRIVRHDEPVRGDRPELSDAQRILADEAARREALFQQSVNAERNRGDALSKRFEEALKQAQPGADHEADAGLRSGLAQSECWI